MSTKPRISYSTSVIEFERHFTSYLVDKQKVINESESLSGADETLFYRSRDFVTVGYSNLQSTDQDKLETFFLYARNGSPFAFHFDRDLVSYHSFLNTIDDHNENTPTYTEPSPLIAQDDWHGTTLNVTANDFQGALSNYEIFDSLKKGTVSFWIKPKNDPLGIGTNSSLFELSDTNDYRMQILFLTSSEISVRFYDNTGTQDHEVKATITGSDFNTSKFTHVAVTWDSDLANQTKLYIDGELFTPGGGGVYTVAALGTNFRIANSSDGAIDNTQSYIGDFELRQDVLSRFIINSRFNARKALGWRRSYWPQMRLEASQNYNPVLLPGSFRHDLTMTFKEIL